MERQNRRLKGALTLMLVMAGMAAFLRARPQRDATLRADRFEPVEESGEGRAILGVAGSGSAFVLRDSGGRDTIKLYGAPTPGRWMTHAVQDRVQIQAEEKSGRISL